MRVKIYTGIGKIESKWPKELYDNVHKRLNVSEQYQVDEGLKFVHDRDS